MREETQKIKDVPITLVTKVNDLESKLNEATQVQAQLENDLREADTAKAQVEKDKTEYFSEAQHLAQSATEERDKRIGIEKKLHWYRWHWWGSWIVLGLGIIAIAVLAFLKFTGRLVIGGMKL